MLPSWVCTLLIINLGAVWIGHPFNYPVEGGEKSEETFDILLELEKDDMTTASETAPEDEDNFQREQGFTADKVETFKSPCHDYASEACGRLFLAEYDRVHSRNSYYHSVITYASRLDLENKMKREKSNALSLEVTQVVKSMLEEARKFQHRSFTPSIARQFNLITTGGPAKDKRISKKAIELKSKLISLYGLANPCPKEIGCLGAGESPMEKFMLEETNYDRLAETWRSWYDIQGSTLKPLYSEFVQYANVGPREHGLKDAGYEEWFIDMEDPDFDRYIWGLLEEVKPLYRELHAYVRGRLRQKYPNRFAANDPIPAHILGNVWAQQWHNIFPLVKPYPLTDISSSVNLALQSKSVTDLVHLGETFFLSLGLQPMTREFWKNSVFEQLPNRVMDCHATAHDFMNGVDFRITMCGVSDKNHLQTIHHEMGHIHYYMQYAHLPSPFRSGANSGFHEAIGDAIALSVMTPEHLKLIGLLKDVPKNEEHDINFLMSMALEKLAFFPFGFLVDVWRWRVFNGSIPEERYNREWWKLRMELQGIMPPMERSEATADALGKYHVPANVPYIRYFLSFIMQFQFYEALCDASDYRGPLHRCDFYGSKAAGKKLMAMLRMGQSKPWKDAMQAITGQRELSTNSMRRYFEPLYEWLKKENRRSNVPVGWRMREDLLKA